MSPDSIHIPLSKRKLLLLFILCLLFVALGIWMQFVANQQSSEGKIYFRNPLYLRVIGIISISFFGSISYFLLIKLKDKTPGLSITNKGIYDNSGALSVGFIPWEDVIDIVEISVYNQIFINVLVKNPEVYINRQKNILKRRIMGLNNKMYGTAIGISTNGLKLGPMKVKELLLERFNAYTSNSEI